MMKMIRCEAEAKYERLWAEYERLRDDHNKVFKDKLVLPKI